MADFFIQSELAREEKEMEKAISEMGEATIRRVYEDEGDDRPLEGAAGDLERLLRVVAKDPKGFEHGKYSVLNPHGHKETITDFGKGRMTCMGCGFQTQVVFLQTHRSWVYECGWRCKRLYWIPRDVGLPTLERGT